MKNFVFIFIMFSILISVSFIYAVSFSPPNLVFNLSVGEKNCQNITLSSDSEKIALSDKWAESKDVAWNPNLFVKSANEHGLKVTYKKELSLDEREVQVCLSGNKPGEYHGILLLSEEQEGNSVIQMGVWLKAVISEKGNEEVVNKKEVNNISSNNLLTGASVVSERNDSVSIWVIMVLIAGIVVLVLISIVVYKKRRNNY